MALSLNTNLAANTAQRSLSGTQNKVGTALERLSSGLRINRAADDAAGLAISEKLRSQVNGLRRAQTNAQDGISLVQTADGALNETHAMLQRMRTLAVQASNGTLQDEQREMMQVEVFQLATQITMSAIGTEFNAMGILDGTFTEKFLQIGANEGDSMPIDIPGAKSRDLGLETPRGSAVKAHWPDHPGHLPEHTPQDPLAPSKPWDDWNEGPTPQLTSSSENMFVPGRYTIEHPDVYDRKGNVVGQLTSDGTRVDFSDGTWAQFDNPVWFDNHMPDPKRGVMSLSNVISIETQDLANMAIGIIDDAIDQVSTIRSGLGAIQNRLGHTINNLGFSSENMAAAESRIRDADMAKEMTELTRGQILQQAGVSMLAQANQTPQSVLKLLG
ncbi:MAG: flagellin [Dermatophilus congolensis]|nr:flagellin [Dermatophilus congolensis]